jgi:hypothetical protein
MNRRKLNRTVVAAAVTGVVGVAAPAALAANGAAYTPRPLDVHGGVVSHVYAPPPLDAGSALPNPVYVTSRRPDDRANRPLVFGTQPKQALGTSRTSSGFDWGDSVVGAGAALLLVGLGLGTVAGTRRIRLRALAGA